MPWTCFGKSLDSIDNEVESVNNMSTQVGVISL